MRASSYGSAIRSILISLLLLVLTIPCAAEERPFHLQGTTAVLGNPFAPEGAGMDGDGTATHLVRWTNDGTIFFDGSSGPPFAAAGIAHFTAADGDHLDVALTGTVDATLAATGTCVIVGGTRRFAGASGTGILTANLIGATLHYTSVGTIDY